MSSLSSPSDMRRRSAGQVDDDASTLEEKVACLATLLKSAEHCIFITGAGASTNAGLRDCAPLRPKPSPLSDAH